MKQGRKRKNFESDYLRGRLWYWGVVKASGASSASEIEHQVSPETFRPRPGPSGGYIYPGYFSKIKNGEKVPGLSHVMKTNKVFPGTDYWFVHPIWDIIRVPHPTPNTILDCIESLDSDCGRALFTSAEEVIDNPSDNSGLEYTQRIFDEMEENCDLDSLASVIAATVHMKQTGCYHSDVGNYFSDVILAIYANLAAQDPFYQISNELLDYIKRFHIDISENNEWGREMATKTAYELIEYNRRILLIIEGLELLKMLPYPPASCLLVAKKHLTPKLAGIITNTLLSHGIEQLMRNPAMSQLQCALHEWEQRFISNKK